MLRRIIVIGIPVLLMVIFIFIMMSGIFLKKPMGKDDHVVKNINILYNDIQQRKWKAASTDRDDLESAWKRVVPRVQFSAERDEMNKISNSLAKLDGFIDGKEKAGALAELKDLENNWRNIGK
ncbi:uncharacterized protein DUF4363 [Scopulibacillus darangshiensis]|uniref:Uncharacterized protein DUF4363 n=1 Tax=Scopulibacillus darangshiensis TaxID=442528 RepID=A0A4R2P697_9BACL|nr:DUF4363 family protein [Scopulibacillus darangshiensis]TCP29315.1 uncharacterized protein DUF4363 [Scopulibacillus darangshiensis]